MLTKRMNRRLCFWDFASPLHYWHNRPGQHRRALQATGGLHRLSRLAPNFPYRRGLLALFLVLPATALAGPAGEQVTGGIATVIRPNAVTTLITQQTPKAIIDWQNFSIAQPEMVRFLQPGADSLALNRVLGQDPSRIYGNLTANGQVFLVNPNGVLFAPGSQVSVHGLLATTHDIHNDDFMAGRYTFTSGATPYTGAEVVNQGTLQAGENGYIVLAGDYTANSGVISARLGQVALASGNRFTIDLEGDELIGLAVNEASLAQRAGVENLGTITADGGQVLMTARVAGELATTVVNNEGLVQALSIEKKNGEIILHGGAAGIVENSGILDASGRNANETGGNVRVLGEKVGMLGQAKVDVSGTNGGGMALIGGDYQGKNPAVQNAQVTYLGQDASIKADATGTGDGGRVIVWADDTTRAYGNISAHGGATGGAGGFVEISGKQLLETTATVDTSAKNGSVGTLLLDPTDITITAAGGAPTSGAFALSGSDQIFDGANNNTSSMGWDYINGLLSANNVIVQTNSAGAGAGNITFSEAGVSAGGANALSFLAENDITVSNTIQFTSSGLFTMVAGWNPASGYVTPTPTHATNTGNMAISAAISSTSGEVKLLAKGAVTVDAPITTTNANVTLNGNNITFTAPGDIAVASGTVSLVSTGTDALTSIPVGTAISGSDIAIKTGNLNLAGTLTANNTASITRYNNGAEVQVGGVGADAPGFLNINLAELGQISASTYSFGDTTSTGGLRVAGPISIPATLSLLTSNVGGSQIVQDAGAFITASNLRAQGSMVTLTLANDVDNLAGKSTAGDFKFVDTDGLNLGTIDTQVGVDASTANVLLNTGDALTQSSGAIITAGGLEILSTGVVTLNEANKVDNLAADMQSGNHGLSFINNKALGIGTVLTTNGIIFSNNTAPIAITTTVGNLAVNQPIASDALGGGPITLTAAGGIALNTAVTATNNTTPAGPVKLVAGPSGITSTAAGIITANGLAVQSLGDVDLSAAPNVITNLAAQIGDGSNTNKNFKFNNSTALNIDTVLAIPGISITTDLNGYNPASPDGVISLTSSGALTQNAAAYLAGKAVYAEGTKIGLTELNPTGVIAGKAAGGSTGDTFAYTSANGVHLSTVNGFQGVQHTNAGFPDTYAVVLTGPSISQDADPATGAPISVPTGKGLEVVTTGPVDLPDGNNSVSLLKVTGTLNGPLNFQDKAALDFTGVTTTNQQVWLSMIGVDLTVSGAISAGSGDIILKGAPNISTSANISGGSVWLSPEENFGNGSLTISNATVSGTTEVGIVTDNLTLTGTGMFSSPAGEIFIHPMENNRPITVGRVACAVGPCLLIPDASTTKFDSLKLAIGNDTVGNVGDPGYPYSISGDIYLGETTAINRTSSGWLGLFTGGDITQSSTAPAITALNLGISAVTGPVIMGGDVNAHNVTNVAAKTGGAFSLDVAGSLTVTSLSGGDPLITVNGITAPGGVDLWVNNDLTLAQLIDAGAGQVVLSSGFGAIVDGNGAGVNNVTASILDLSAYNNIELDAQVSSYTATSNFGTVTVRPYPPATSTPSEPTLPTIDACITDPTLAGCETVLPSVDDCTIDPTLPGCSTVLPTLDACITDPTAAGCTAVLPTLDACITDPTAAGCTAVLPTLDTCITDPTAAGCTTVLPTLDTCILEPAAPGCTAVLPPLTDCTISPALPGCTAVLPTIDTCTSTPTAPGCTAVLPPLADCTTNPALPGCTAVLPPLDSCTSNPTLPGCAVVLPPLTSCVTDPTLPGCTAVLPLPVSGETPVEIVETIQAVVIVDLTMPPQTAPSPDQPASSSQANAASGNGDTEENRERRAEEVPLTTASQELPLAKQPIFDLNGGGVAGQNMVCK